MVHLVVMGEHEREHWLSSMWVDYRDQLVDAGYRAEEAERNIARNRAELFVDGVPNESQHFFDVRDGVDRVGALWLAAGEGGAWFVYDVVVEADRRGRGYGRATMLAAEEYVRGQGGSSLSLNVFGPNAVARGLYESLGYATLAVAMRKSLE